MARKAFYSFHYVPDNWRASQVRNIGTVEGNKPCSDNDWESVTGQGDKAIQKWIDDQLSGRSCAIVLIGAKTAGRKWISYEIEKAWIDEKGIFGIHIHNLKDSDEAQSTKGGNPFEFVSIDGEKLSSIVKTYDPPYSDSKDVYDHIKSNLESWVEEAIKVRGEKAACQSPEGGSEKSEKGIASVRTPAGIGSPRPPERPNRPPGPQEPPRPPRDRPVG